MYVNFYRLNSIYTKIGPREQKEMDQYNWVLMSPNHLNGWVVP